MTPSQRRPRSGVTLEQAFGNAVRKLRTDRGLSQEKLAFACGRHPTFISLIERGQRSPTLRTVFLLAGALGVKPSRILAKVEASISGRYKIEVR